MDDGGSFEEDPIYVVALSPSLLRHLLLLLLVLGIWNNIRLITRIGRTDDFQR